MPKLNELTAREAARRLAAREITAEQMARACLARIEEREGTVGAWIHVDPGAVLAQARRLDAGPVRGPLHGLPIGVKDIIDTIDMPTSYGSAVYPGHRPAADAACVALARAAGALILGKTVSTEFAWFHPGKTANPRDPRCTPGGSSSGSAAAVAARMVPLAFGTQTIGSNVRPASYCGLVGLKPTFGRISTRGVIPLSYTQDHVGLMARCVEDIALALSVAAGRDPGDASSSRVPVGDYVAALTRRRAPRVGLLREFFERATPEVTDVTGQAINRLARGGVDIEEAKMPPTFRAVAAAAYVITRSETASVHAERFALKADLYRPGIRSSIEMGMVIPGDFYVRALRIRRQFRREMGPLLERYDVLLTPTTPTPAPEGMATGDASFQLPWSISGLPSITVPCGLTNSGLPLGVQLISGPFTEALLLSAAAWCEDILGRASAPSL